MTKTTEHETPQIIKDLFKPLAREYNLLDGSYTELEYFLLEDVNGNIKKIDLSN